MYYKRERKVKVGFAQIGWIWGVKGNSERNGIRVRRKETELLVVIIADAK